MRHHVPLVPLAPRPAPPLGFFPTLVWGFVIFTVSGLFYGVWIALAAVSEWTGFSFIYAPMECALILAVIKQKSELPPGQYLCIAPVRLKTILTWTGALVLLITGEEIFTQFVGNPGASSESASGAPNQDSLWTIWLALIVAAPLMEEVFFRGFLFKGLEASAAGPAGAIFITSFTWAILHVQYDVFGMTLIFFAGLLLGAARVVTRSILTPLCLHAAMNLWVCVEALYLGQLPV